MKQKFEREYELKTSPRIVYPYLSTASGLQDWFADKVLSDGYKFSFTWQGVSETADITQIRENVMVRFEWKNSPTHDFFEFRLRTDELTGDLALIVIDVAEKADIDDAIDLWDAQIYNLKQHLAM